MSTGKSRRRVVVVGSGPAGVACAAALAERGLTPLVVDGGRRLSEERARTVAALGAVEPTDWEPEVLAELYDAFDVDVDRLPLKPSFGSLHPYDEDSVRRDGVGAVPSLAVGGLSTVWGAAVLPYGEREHAGWPFGAAALAPHYRAVVGFLPLAAEEDALAEEFPLHTDGHVRLRPTRQVEALLRDLAASRPALRAGGVLAGRARLALDVGACRYTGLCMIGCPYGAIYDSSRTLARLVAEAKAEHRPGFVVERFEEDGDCVRLRGAGEELVAERVFVAAGALGTPRLVLASLGLHDVELPLRDSCYFTVPLLRRRSAGRVGPETAGNTLAQVFLEIDDPHVSAHRVHLQLYAFNALMLKAAAARSRLPEHVVERLFQPLLARLLYLQGYLHSDESAQGRLRLSQVGGREVLLAEAPPHDPVLPRAVLAKLRSLRRELGFVPVGRMLQVWPLGKGFHAGGSLPMRERPGELETDLLGRPDGLRRVHLVDATVLPTVPAQTITLPVMANAHRIGTEAVG